MSTIRSSVRRAGGVCPEGVGVCPLGVSARRGVSAWRGVCPGGLPGGCIPACTGGRHPPPQTPVKILPCHNYVADGNDNINFSEVRFMGYILPTPGLRKNTELI